MKKVLLNSILVMLVLLCSGKTLFAHNLLSQLELL